MSRKDQKLVTPVGAPLPRQPPRQPPPTPREKVGIGVPGPREKLRKDAPGRREDAVNFQSPNEGQPPPPPAKGTPVKK